MIVAECGRYTVRISGMHVALQQKTQRTFPICAGLPDDCRTLCAVNLLSCIVIGAYLFVGNGHVSLGVTITSYIQSDMET